MITNPVNSLSTRNILNGVNILLKYSPDGDFYALHDILFFGDLGRRKIQVSEEDKKILEDLNWFIDQQYSDNEWCKYV